MRRSLLFIPGNTPGMIQNASLFEADSVIFDLEDAVSLQEKDAARTLLSCFLAANDDIIPEVIVRMNAYGTPEFEADFESIVCHKVDALMIPKATTEDLLAIEGKLEQCELLKGLSKKIKLIPIIELAMSLLEVDTMVRVSRVDGVLLGAEDLTSDMEVERTQSGEEITYARSKITVACKAYKIDAIDTPFVDTTDEVGLKEDAMKAKRLGMNAKACIHPNQIATINALFSPSPSDILYAKRVVQKASEMEQQGIGVFNLDGKMIDKPIIERMKKVIERAHKFGLVSHEK